MTIRTLLLDDDENSRLAACTALSACSDIEIVGQFSKREELFDFLEKQSAHLLFLDIELDQDSGFAVAKRLRQSFPELMIVFLTGHSSYAIDGYDFQPVNFLTKPINAIKLEQTLAEVRRLLGKSHEQRSTKLMFHLQQGGYRILDVRDICYIERLHRKNYMHTVDEVLCIANYTMHELEEMLSEHGFFLGHQSYLISLYRVEAVRDIGRQLYEVQLKDCGAAVPISRNRYEKLLALLKRMEIRML